MKRSKKGFTLAELLIVIAIIAILIAVMFPVFGAQLNKARAAADLANVRAKYSELVADKMLGDDTSLTNTNFTIEVSLKDLAGAMTYDGSEVQYVENKTGDDVTSKEIKVSHGGYEGTFKIDLDVTVSEGPGPLGKDGNAVTGS